MSDHNLTLRIDTEAGPLDLDVRHFAVKAETNRPYQIDLVAYSRDAGIDLDTVIGLPGTFTLQAGARGDSPILTEAKPRKWTGIVSEAAHVTAEEEGYSTYRIRIVPRLWLLTQRTDIRIFQHLSELEIVLRILDGWEIPTTLRVDRDAHRRREYRTQYEETDFDFVNRLMEEAGITYFFDSSEEQAGRMIITDAPQRVTPRERALTFQENPLDAEGMEHATAVELVRRVAPGKVALVDHDFRRPPEVPIVATAQGGLRTEERLEMFDYRDGHFLYVAGDAGDPEDPGDQRGPARTDEREAQNLASKRLRAFRARAKETHFGTNAGDVDIGQIVKIEGHSRPELGTDGLLVTELEWTGGSSGTWQLDTVGTSAAEVYRPPLRTPRPVASGVESATVVGPDRNKSHKDRHGRIFVHFHWDRDEYADEYTTCWMHVSQPWGGANYGAGMMPRPGQEVIVSFFGSDPDRPVVVGRYHTAIQQPLFRYPSQDEEGGMISWSDDGSGGNNKMTWRDRAGQEMLHFRAQRDKTVQVNRNSDTNVGVDASLSVGQNRSIEVAQNERRWIGAERSISVRANQTTTVKQNVMLVSEEASIVHAAANAHVIHARFTEANAQLQHRFFVGQSSIIMTPDCIVIKSPKVMINPSDTETRVIRDTGRTLEDHRQARNQAIADNIGRLQRAGRPPTPAEYQRRLASIPPRPPAPPAPPAPPNLWGTNQPGSNARSLRPPRTARAGGFQRRAQP